MTFKALDTVRQTSAYEGEKVQPRTKIFITLITEYLGLRIYKNLDGFIAVTVIIQYFL